MPRQLIIIFSCLNEFDWARSELISLWQETPVHTINGLVAMTTLCGETPLKFVVAPSHGAAGVIAIWHAIDTANSVVVHRGDAASPHFEIGEVVYVDRAYPAAATILNGDALPEESADTKFKLNCLFSADCASTDSIVCKDAEAMGRLAKVHDGPLILDEEAHQFYTTFASVPAVAVRGIWNRGDENKERDEPLHRERTMRLAALCALRVAFVLAEIPVPSALSREIAARHPVSKAPAPKRARPNDAAADGGEAAAPSAAAGGEAAIRESDDLPTCLTKPEAARKAHFRPFHEHMQRFIQHYKMKFVDPIELASESVRQLRGALGEGIAVSDRDAACFAFSDYEAVPASLATLDEAVSKWRRAENSRARDYAMREIAQGNAWRELAQELARVLVRSESAVMRFGRALKTALAIDSDIRELRMKIAALQSARDELMTAAPQRQPEIVKQLGK